MARPNQLQAENTALRAQIATLNARITDLQAQISAQSATLAALQAENANLQGALDSALAEIATLKGELEKRPPNEEEVARLRLENAALKVRQAELEADLAEANGEINRLRAALVIAADDLKDANEMIAALEAQIAALEQEIVRLKVLIVSNPPNPEPPPEPDDIVAQSVTPSSANIYAGYTGPITTLVFAGGIPNIYSNPVIADADGADLSIVMVNDTTAQLSLDTEEAEGALSITVTVDNDAGTSAPLALTVNVLAVAADVIATPETPFQDRQLTLAGSFPTTIASVTGISGITAGEAFASEAALKTRIQSLGGNVLVYCPAGGTYAWGTIGDYSLAIEALPGDPTYVNTFDTGQDQSADKIAFLKGFTGGPNASILEQNSARTVNSGGPYQIVPGDTITGATSGATAKIISVELVSGSWAAGTATAKLVFHDKIGTFTNENLDVGANLNVATMTNGGNFTHGPRAQSGSSVVFHKGVGSLKIVDCDFRNTGWNAYYCEGDEEVYNATGKFFIYDSEASYSGNLSGEHLGYIHYTNHMLIRCVLHDRAGGTHLWKAESWRFVALDCAFVSDMGSVDGIAEATMTAAAQSIAVDGYMSSGGEVVFDSGAELVRLTFRGDCRGCRFEISGNAPGGAPITELVVGLNGGTVTTVQRFESVQGPILKTLVAGTTAKSGMIVSFGHGISNTSNQEEDVNISRVQDKRMARCYIQRVSIGTSPGSAMGTAARSGKYGGHHPTKFPHVFVTTNIGTDNITPWASRNFDGDESQIIISGLVAAAIPSSATSINVSGIGEFLHTTDPLISPITAIPHTVRILRIDGTILEVTSTPENITLTTATFPLGQALGGGGAAKDGFVAFKPANLAWDTIGLNPALYNRNDPNYVWQNGARGFRGTFGGELDFSRDTFPKGFFEDNMISINATTTQTLFRPEAIWQHAYWSKANLTPELPYPPQNKPQGADVDWPDVAGAGSWTSPLAGVGTPRFGRHPTGWVSRDNIGPNCDFIWPWPDLFKNLSWYLSPRYVATGATLRHFSNLDQTPTASNSIPRPDVRYVNAAGDLVKVVYTNPNPLPNCIGTLTVGSHSTSATKIYVQSNNFMEAGMRAHIELKPHIRGQRQIHPEQIEEVGSDGGGHFIRLSTGLPRSTVARAEVAVITEPALIDPPNWIGIADYATL